MVNALFSVKFNNSYNIRRRLIKLEQVVQKREIRIIKRCRLAVRNHKIIISIRVEFDNNDDNAEISFCLQNKS